MYHAESDSWFEVFSEKEKLFHIERHGCDDVTGMPKHEQAFKRQK